MSLNLNVAPGHVFVPDETITVDSLNELGKPTVSLNGTVSAALIGAQAVNTSNLKDGALAITDEGRAKMAAGYVLPSHLDASVVLGGAPRGFRGLKATASGTTVTVAALEATLRNAAGLAAYGSGLTGLTATIGGTAGTLGRLDAGAIAANTWYTVYVVGNGSGGFGTQFSLSDTAPSPLVAGYGYYARVGQFYVGASTASWVGLVQADQRVWYAAELASASLTGSVSWAALALTGYVPPSASVAVGNVGIKSSATSRGMALAMNNAGGGGQYFGAGMLGTAWGGAYASAPFRVPVSVVSGNATLYYKTDAATAAAYQWQVAGWEY